MTQAQHSLEWLKVWLGKGGGQMRTTEKLKLAWPALLKMAERGSVTIYGRGIRQVLKVTGSGRINESLVNLYEINNGTPSGLLSESELLEMLAKEGK